MHARTHEHRLTSSLDSVMVVVILEPRKMTGMILVSTEVMVVTYEVVEVLKCVVAGTSTLSNVCVLDTVVTVLVAGP